VFFAMIMKYKGGLRTAAAPSGELERRQHIGFY